MSRARGSIVGRRELKICLISDDYPSANGCGGVGTYTYVLAQGLAQLGHRVHVITRDWGNGAADDVDGVRVHRVPVSDASGRIGMKFGETWHVVAWNLAVSRIVRRISADEGLDVIESPEYRAQGLFTTFTQRRVPMVVRLHGGGYYNRVTLGSAMGWSRCDTWISEYMERSMVRRARTLVSASNKLASWCAKLCRVDAHAIRGIPLPVDDELFRPEAGTGSNPDTLLYVGRISALKGVDTLIEALPAIVDAVPAARLRLVGREEHGHPVIGRFRRRLRDAGLPETAVEFVGPVRRSALPALYSSAAVCLVPSPGGSSGYTCLEPMACGCAVVAAADEQRHGVITDDVNGLLVPPRSAEALTSAATRLLLDPPLRRRLGSRATATVRERFGSNVVCSETVKAYGSLLAYR